MVGEGRNRLLIAFGQGEQVCKQFIQHSFQTHQRETLRAGDAPAGGNPVHLSQGGSADLVVIKRGLRRVVAD